MFKVLLISVVIVSCGAQLNIPKRFGQVNLESLQGAPVPLVEAPVAIQEEAIAVAPGPAVASIAQPIGQIQLRSGYQQLASPLLNPIYRIRTQEVLPSQDLDVSANPEGFVNVRSAQEPVLVHYQTHSAPIQVQTSHVPSAPGETTVTQVQDEPHRVIHEVIRPVIQEVREIIQPYRRVTQEIRPVQEQVHSEVAAGAPAAAQVAVAAPVQTVVSAPARTLISAQTPTLVSAPAQAVYGGQYGQLYGQQYAVSAPVQTLERANWGGLGVIAAPSPLYTGSYIQSFIEQLRARQSQGGVILSQPNYAVQGIQSVQVQPAVAVEAVEPVAAEAVTPVAVPQKVVANRGGVRFTQKHVEY